MRREVDLSCRTEELNRFDSLLQGIQSPLRGSNDMFMSTQGSQSLALGLVLTAAPQLVSVVHAKENIS